MFNEKTLKLVVLILLSLQTILSQNIGVLEDPVHDVTISTKRPAFLDTLFSNNKGIPVFLVDEGLVLDGCEKEVGNKRKMKCSINKLKLILVEKIKPKSSQILHQGTRIVISTTLIIDTTGKVNFEGVAVSKEGLKVKEGNYFKLAKQVEQIVKGFPKLSPAKMNGILCTVRTTISTEVMFDL